MYVSFVKKGVRLFKPAVIRACVDVLTASGILLSNISEEICVDLFRALLNLFMISDSFLISIVLPIGKRGTASAFTLSMFVILR